MSRPFVALSSSIAGYIDPFCLNINYYPIIFEPIHAHLQVRRKIRHDQEWKFKSHFVDCQN